MNTWPPPPTIGGQSAPVKSRSSWFRPAFWLAVGFNVLACAPALQLMGYPPGSTHSDDVAVCGSMGFVLFFAAPLSFFVGTSFAVWQVWKRQAQGRPIWLEAAGLLLCLTPAFVGFGLLMLVLKAKHFVLQ